MKRTCSLNTNTDENLIYEFHPTLIKKLFTDEKNTTLFLVIYRLYPFI